MMEKAKINNHKSQIIFICSPTGICSFIGYSTDSPSKFALRGFSDAIRTELKGFNI